MDIKLAQETDAWMYLEADVKDDLDAELGREPTEEEVEKAMNEITQEPGFDIQDYVSEYQMQGLIY
jgi:DNA-directed RNA polymerase specialized sigma subunit